MGSQRFTDRDPSSRAGLEENSGSPWVWVLSAYALVLVSLVLLHALGTDGKYFIRSLVCIAPAAALSLVGVCILIQQYWRLARRESNFADAVQVAVFLAFPIIIVTFEAFAGLTALLWSRGLLFSTSALDPSLWTVEKFYAWSVIQKPPIAGSLKH